jgi:hypothetical protein
MAKVALAQLHPRGMPYSIQPCCCLPLGGSSDTSLSVSSISSSHVLAALLEGSPSCSWSEAGGLLLSVPASGSAAAAAAG